MSRKHKKKGPPPKALIRQCAWCKKPLVKAGQYLVENNEPFCGTVCLNESRTRNKVIRRELDGQKSVVEGSGRTLGELEQGWTPPDPPIPLSDQPGLTRNGLVRGITVEEFLNGRSDEELSRLAAVLAERNAKPGRRRLWIASAAALILILSGLLVHSVLRQNRFYDIALENKRKTERLRAMIEDLAAAQRPPVTDTAPAAAGTRPPRRRPIDYSRPQPLVANQYAGNRNFTRGDLNRPILALTFDGADHAAEARAILDTLASRSIRATFFLSGPFIRHHADLVRRMAAEGHVLANHTADHPHLTTWEENGRQDTRPGITSDYLLSQLRRVDSLYDAIGVRHEPIWRAPYGEQNAVINGWAEKAGYRHVGWTQGTSWQTNLDTNDWVESPNERGYFSSDEVIRKIVNFGRGTAHGLNGGIVLMHLGTIRTQDRLYLKLGVIIDTLKNSGYGFATIPEML